MSANQTAIGILEYGKLLLDEHERYCQAPRHSRLQQAETQLIARLQHDRSPSLTRVFGFDPRASVDSLALRVLSYVAYLSLCTNCIGVTMNPTRILVLVILASLVSNCAVKSNYRPPVFSSPGKWGETGEGDLLAETVVQTNFLPQ